MSFEQDRRMAFTIDEFAEAHRMSRGMVYKLWKAGIGPRWMNVGSKRIITDEAAAEWRRERQAAAEACQVEKVA